MKNYLFILRKAPHSGLYVQEMLDVILTTAAFEQPVSLLLLDDAVFSLKKGQHTKTAGLKNTSAIFDALQLYDITNIYTETESLRERGLFPSDLTLAVRPFYRRDIGELMQGFDVLFAG